jgi:hypothetical protein
MWIVNGNAHSKNNIPHSKKCFILVSYWLVITVLVSYWSAFTFFILNMDSRKYADICFTIHIMKVLRQSPMCIHDVVGKSAVCYLHHEGAEVIAKCLHKEISRALPTS